MSSSDEQLLHTFYAGDTEAINQLIERYDPILARIAHQILLLRGVPAPVHGEWDIDDRLSNLWAHVYQTRMVNFGRWPHQQLSALRWVIFLLCAEMDRTMGFRPPF